MIDRVLNMSILAGIYLLKVNNGNTRTRVSFFIDSLLKFILDELLTKETFGSNELRPEKFDSKKQKDLFNCNFL